jgi:hypothetical protein
VDHANFLVRITKCAGEERLISCTPSPWKCWSSRR